MVFLALIGGDRRMPRFVGFLLQLGVMVLVIAAAVKWPHQISWFIGSGMWIAFEIGTHVERPTK
jgi:hypothetical protein